jgi:tetratricopeptide (TPR) repeat protein
MQAEILFAADRSAEARSVLDEMARSERSEELSLAAGVYQRVELYDEAIAVLARLVEIEPDDLEHRFWLASAYERTQRYAQAQAGFEGILAADPEFAPALNYLGYMWAEQGVRLQEALRLVRKAVSLEPENGAYVDSLGWAHYRLGEYEEARDHLERAIELEGADATIYEHLGDTYRALGRLEQARDHYRRALDLDGDNAAAVARKLDELE